MAPSWIGKLTLLEELQVPVYFSNVDKMDNARRFLEGLGRLTELRVFQSSVYAVDESMQQDLVLSLCKLSKLQHLYFCLVDENCWIDADRTF